jgi:hypothetical protein
MNQGTRRHPPAIRDARAVFVPWSETIFDMNPLPVTHFGRQASICWNRQPHAHRD